MRTPKEASGRMLRLSHPGTGLLAVWLFFLTVAILGLFFIPRDSPSRFIAWFLLYIMGGPMVLTLFVRAKQTLRARKKKEPNQAPEPTAPSGRGSS